ncbi:MAG TPA: hypothetical protein DDY78_06080 [Planctomycetales bacterium]|nr:hypothetical protein [Planctomycetales bacterium]
MNVFLRRVGGFTVRWAPFVVPPCYFLLIVCLQPCDHMGPPDAAPWLHSSLYDDYDATALALRGLNAARGRMAGAANPPTPRNPDDFNRTLDDPYQTLKPRYHLEYPPSTLLLFRLGWVGQADLDSFPPAILDGDYNAIVQHEPRDDQERQWWNQFRRAMQLNMLLMVVCGLGLTAVLRAGYEPAGGLSSSGLLLLLPASLYFTLNRFDVLPALLAALSFACLGRRWTAASAVFLAAAMMVKVYPVLLAPLVLRYLLPEWRRAGLWALCYTGTALAFLLPPLLLEGWPTVWESFHFQLTREPMPFTAYGPLLPLSLAANDAAGRAFRLGTLALTIAVLCWTRPADVASLLRRGAVVLVVFISLSVTFSPQWVLWLAPLCIPLARRNWPLAGLIIALDLATYFTFPVYSPIWGPCDTDGVVHAVYARFAVLAVLAAVLLWQDRRRTPQAAALSLVPNERFV